MKLVKAIKLKTSFLGKKHFELKIVFLFCTILKDLKIFFEFLISAAQKQSEWNCPLKSNESSQ